MTDQTNSVGGILPNHVGIILDGNRRWAKARGLKTIEGHKEGAEVFKNISLAAFKKGVKVLSAFVFSTENWQRTEDEVAYLMKLVVRGVELHLDEFHKNNIRVLILGSREPLSKTVMGAIKRTEEKTAQNTGGTLALCFNYGGKVELVQAVRDIVSSSLAPQEIDEATIDRHLYSPEVPQVDLMIRTSGEHRTSGFMLWRSDYAELYFVDKMWPDFTIDDLENALQDYGLRKRRFGK